MKQITVKELQKACNALVKQGMGNKKILLSDDDEGNGYHEMFFLFTPMSEFSGVDLEYCNIHSFEDNDTIMKDYIVLG